MKTIRAILVVLAGLSLVLWIAEALIPGLQTQRLSFSQVSYLLTSSHALNSVTLIFVCLLLVGALLSDASSRDDQTGEPTLESAEAFHLISNAAQDAIIIMNDRGKVSFWNPAANRMFGYPAHEAVGKELHELLAPPRSRDAYRESFIAFRETGQGSAIGKTRELQALRKDGIEIPVELSLSALQLNGTWHAAGILRDITARKKTEELLRSQHEQLARMVEERTAELEKMNERLRREVCDRACAAENLQKSERFLGTIFDSIHDPFSIVDADFTIIRVNEAYARMKNKSVNDLRGRHCYEALYGRNSVCAECVVEKTFRSSDPCATEKKALSADGVEQWMEIYTYPILDDNRKVTHVIEYARDITDRKKAEEEKTRLIKDLNRLSTTDGLTGLFNRRALNDILNLEIERANRYCADLSLMICDIDRFKQINDTHGHRAGDLAIQAVTKALSGSLRKSDIVGRYGGDEFMMILPETNLAGAKSIADKVRSAVENIRLDLPGGREIRLSMSIGVAACCEPLEDIDTIVARADAALYSSKRQGRNMVTAAIA